MIVPVVFSVVVPVPLVKVPFWIVSVPVLRLGAPMAAVAAPVRVNAEPAPVTVTAPVFTPAKVETDKAVPVTVAPLWMLNVPTVPALMVLST